MDGARESAAIVSRHRKPRHTPAPPWRVGPTPNARITQAVRDGGIDGFFALDDADRLRAAGAWSCEDVALEPQGEQSIGVEDGAIVTGPLSVKVTANRWDFHPDRLDEAGWFPEVPEGDGNPID